MEERRFEAGVLTISDKGSRGEREDESGPLIQKLLEQTGIVATQYAIVPDEHEIIAQRLQEWADQLDLALILTTGGTGLAPRDVTPEATLKVLDRQASGLAEALRAEGIKHNARAMLSRGVSGIRGRTLIINLPGSVKGVTEGLAVIMPVLLHALAILREEPADHA